MVDVKKALSDTSLVLVFTYAKTGFGHLRVTDALYHGLPKGIQPILLESQDRSITFLHRISSIHPFTRAILEWAQRGWAESVVTYVYRALLHTQTSLITQQLETILDQRVNLPQKVLVVSTHFGLGHQIASVKEKLARMKKVKIFLVVQVTDDSPQKMWYTPGADLTVVPSEYTKKKLLEYGRSANLPIIPIEVLPYPVSPTLATVLTEREYQNRMHQVHPNSDAHIHMAIPISGAAVGLQFFTEVIDELYLTSQRFRFFVVTKSTLPTQSFVNEMLKRHYVKLIASSVDKGVVEAYEQLYLDENITLEITKPSEQAFKALIDPERRGGPILLFSLPVGRQEYDNLNFLARHNLIPHMNIHHYMWDKAWKKLPLSADKQKELLKLASSWRGIRIPDDPKESAQFIWWCVQHGIFSAMIGKKISPMKDDKEHFEILGAESTHLFWEKVATYISAE